MRPLTADEVRRVRESFSGSLSLRNRALFALGVNTGFRISEILSLTLGDILDADGRLLDRLAVARRRMKGGKESRSVKLNSQARQALIPWLRELRQREYINRHDPLFPSFLRKNQPITRVTAWRILKNEFRRCHLPGPLATHSMRKTFANNVYNLFLNRVANGAHIDPFRSTSKALGHADINSTDKYLSFRSNDIDEAVEEAGV